ncbi:hypothetical protein [Coxiella burnetii]|uniref:Uncharacterized protein n=2 Tax=Coxiella burnetii TaxID=777 RepID=B5QSD4_COXBU|nr:hypothetical protein [Coxiella burnetii]YP_002333007.1 hypothetical protein CBU_1458a [Coxiella burnetii RSA 493]ABS78040.1 hypothetical protein CBUD_0498 [Coxiella burnetii Dugway 5J108-111]ABX77772.1 hypothetical protein COXBURSA331_A1631 [Coxiella burnetii RSA 331]ACI15298.1 hypothetical protein CBU_1458a [Coxiella burnetii RSA 493]ACJ17967.1 hypothetical protein CbuG_0552 [Coxiella burnetii CbuG_Q212]ACJ20825.1 hypothetical protein CbuK_1687 [Coxiella burnetii CbuK_Q154]
MVPVFRFAAYGLLLMNVLEKDTEIRNQCKIAIKLELLMLAIDIRDKNL